MKIQLEELAHQQQALDAIINSFHGLDNYAPQSENPDYVYANPLIRGRYTNSANIDIKMETGTGKTYVGTRMIYELHRQFGLFKFIIVVPTPAIKEGWKNFLTADYARQHFAQFYENVHLDVNVINSGDFKAKSGRKNMPAHLNAFIEGDRLNANTIQVLLINDGMLRSKSLMNEYDQTMLSGFFKPIEGLQATRPVVLVDEPHRFPRELKKGEWVGKANYQAIEKLQPQMIVRFGATFNLDKKTDQRDYYRGEPQFNLNAVESFNQGLVKAIDIYYPTLSETQAKNSYRVKSVKAKELALAQGTTTWTVGVDEDLSNVDNAFDGDVTYAGSKQLSNGLELSEGMRLIPGTFAQSYQELIVRDAIDKHFEKERENFLRPSGRVKTLSLFFIDSIASYGVKNPEGTGRKAGWLAEMFDRLLLAKLDAELKKAEFAPAAEQDYYAFLRATKADLSAARAAYFGEDRQSGDAGIQAEIDDILSNKEKMLSFKDANGNWNTRRFLFSKWTLREGWDNPNVFVIAKLRTSGSENSKIQEVGRGLRLPVDEFGHRLSEEEFRLAFLIGYDEKDFADKLVADINQDIAVKLDEHKLTDKTIEMILANHPELDEDSLLEQLDDLDIIKRNNDFKEGGFAKLKAQFPELENTLRKGKVTTNVAKPKQTLKLKKENWRQLRELWAKLAKRYMVVFEAMTDAQWATFLEDLFDKEGNEIFQLQYASQVHQRINVGEEASLNERTTDYEVKQTIGVLTYGQFLEQAARRTKLPIRLLHRQSVTFLKGLEPQRGHQVTDYLNEQSLANFIRKFTRYFETRFAESVKFDVLDFEAKTTVWDATHHDFVDEVTAGFVGEYEVNDDLPEDDKQRALYVEPPLRFDSRNPELALLKHGYAEQIVTFGKLPKKAIQIPKFTGGTTTPDFVYKVGRDLYLLVDTKPADLRDGEKRTVKIQEQFLTQLSDKVHYKVAETVQEVTKELDKLQRENSDA